MSDHKKIDWLRWHKRKYFIRINCFIMVCILLIVLLLQFPIVHADEPTVGDYFHMEDILNYEDALSHNGESGYYNVPDNIFNAPTFYGSKGDVSSYYDKLKAVFELPFSTFSGVGTNYNMTICKQLNSDNLVIIFEGQSISLNYQGDTYSYIRPPSIYSDTPKYFVFDGSNIISSGYYQGGSYKDISDCDYILFTSMNVNMYYQNADRNLNYLKIDNKMGQGSGGFGVPDPDTSIEDNMFLYGGGVALSSSTFKDGILYVCALPTNTQVNDNYKIIVDVNGFVSVTPDSLFSLLFNGYSMSRMYGIVAGQTNSRQFSGQIEIPFSDFSNGVYTLQLDNVYEQCHVSGYDSNFLKLAEFITTNSNGWNMAYAPFYNYVVGAKSFGIKDFSLSLPAFLNPIDEQNKFNINGATVTFNMYVSNSDGSKTSEGSYTFTHDFVSGRSNTVDNITKTPDEVADSTNDNDYNNYEPSMPVIPNDSPQQPSYQNPLVPSNNTDNSSSNSNVINNPQSNSINNNISIMQSNKYPEKGVMQSFIRIINNDKNNAVNDVNTLVAGNEFINLCNNTLYAVPNQYWNVWLVALKAILGICVSAFFLKILINWAT